MIQRLYTHSTDRLKWLEYYLPPLEKEGKISSTWFNGEKVYQLGKKKPNKAHIPHHQICGEALLRIKDAIPKVKFYSERKFRGFKLGAVPDWAAFFLSGSMLFFEYSTADNFSRKGLMKNKVEQYQESLERIESYFGGWGIVLFVIDAPRLDVEIFAKEFPDDALYFVDLCSFMKVGKCDQLDAPIYIWGFDGGSYPLN